MNVQFVFQRHFSKSEVICSVKQNLYVSFVGTVLLVGSFFIFIFHNNSTIVIIISLYEEAMKTEKGANTSSQNSFLYKKNYI